MLFEKPNTSLNDNMGLTILTWNFVFDETDLEKNIHALYNYVINVILLFLTE